jgi:DNA-directed RNA polymerase specialized sigma24 family protein
MANDQAVAELENFLAERADQLMRTAALLTGSRDAGQDLLQTGLERLLRHWPTLSGDPEAYLRRTLYNLAADGFRRQVQLPPRQRTVLVLRYWEQLTEAETAAALGWPEGTVKSAASRGLRRLRGLADSWYQAELHETGLRGPGR